MKQVFKGHLLGGQICSFDKQVKSRKEIEQLDGCRFGK